MKILIIDDSKTARLLMDKALREIGYTEITQCESGEAGLEIIKKCSDKERFDLILVDWHMKGMTGLDFLGKIKFTLDTAELPVMMVTTEQGKMNVARAVKTGADEYLIKPVKADILRRKIQTLVEKFGLDGSVSPGKAEGPEVKIGPPAGQGQIPGEKNDSISPAGPKQQQSSLQEDKVENEDLDGLEELDNLDI